MLPSDMSRLRPPAMLAPLLAGLGLLSTCSWGGGAAERTNPAPVPVTVAPAVQKDAPVSLRAIGNVAAYSTVSLKAQVEGRVARVHFAEGQEVKRGDLLFALDARPFEAALRQAEGNLARDRAQAETARVEASRFARLVKAGVVSQDEYDQANARAASDHPVVGTLSFINNTVDTASGTVLLKAIFPNANEELWPGQFVTVTLRLATRHDAVMIPSRAVQTGQDGKFVFVVQPDGTVASRPVSVGQTVGQEVVVEQGLAAGEQVVTEGQLRLAPGVRVQVKEEAV